VHILLVTDAWQPQVNSVVTTLVELVRQLQATGHTVTVIQPGQFRTRPCPGYPGLELALFPGRRLTQWMDAAGADAIHLATEGPLGWAARRHCLRRGWPFTTAFHTRFPDILKAALGVPLSWGYALFRQFHRPSQGVLVPTSGVLELLRDKGFGQLRAWTHGVDTRLFAYAPEPVETPSLGHLARPVSLCVGRLSHEKNIRAFLDLDLPGSKVVCGTGPLEAGLRDAYPNVHWVGVLPRRELARVYAAADVFVFPSRNETFGLVVLEAMACGLPVAAFPVDGPLQVVGDSPCGALDDDLYVAWTQALKVRRSDARERALAFGWERAAALFVSHLAPLSPSTRGAARFQGDALPDTPVALTRRRVVVSHKRHAAVE
jgi:glycosyltransferase involved in cell wall biosynthesis